MNQPISFVDLFSQGFLDCFEFIERTEELSVRKEPQWCGSDVQSWISQRDDSFQLAAGEIDRSYPGHSERFDLHLVFRTGQSVFVEGKGAWKSYWIDRGNPKKFDYYLFGPLVGVANREKKKSAAWDLKKLATLTPNDATHVSLVLMGSARPQHKIDSELDRFAELSVIDRSPWQVRQRTWENRHSPGYSYDCRIWTCSVGDMSAWWEGVCDKFESS